MIAGCYRKGDAEEPEIYMAALAAILSNYPEPIVARVADPRTGIAGKSQFLPTVAEVRHACEIEMRPIHEEARRKALERERQSVGPSPNRAGRKTFEELVEAYPGIVGQSGSHRNIAPSPNSAEGLEESLRAKFANKPLTVSDSLRRQNGERAVGMAKAVGEGR